MQPIYTLAASFLLAGVLSTGSAMASPFASPPPLPLTAVGDALSCAAPVAPSVMALSDALEQALCANPGLRAYAQDLQAATADISRARAAYLPDLSATLQANQVDSQGLRQHDVALRWLLLDFGGRESSLAAAAASASAAEATLRDQAQALALEVSLAFFQAQAADASLQAAQAQLEVAQRALAVASARHKVGEAIKLDVLQAQSSLAQGEQQLTQAQADARTRRAHLAMLLAVPAEDSGALQLAPVEDLQVQVPEQALADLVEQARNERQDLQADRKRVDALSAQANAARAAHLPSVSLVGNMRWTNSQPAGTRRTDTVGVQVNIPIFSGGATQAQVDRLQAQAQAQQERLAAAQNRAGYDVVNSFVTLQTSAAQLNTAEALLRSSTEAQAQALARYEAGVGTMLEAFDSMSKRASAQQNLIAARLALQSARVQLARQLGQMPTF